jgi:hypothetical protein
MGTNITGVGGSLTLTNATASAFNVSSWSASLIPTVVDTTGFNASGYYESTVSAIRMVGSFVATGQAGVGNLLPSTGANPSMSSYTGSLTLGAASSNRFAMNAVITGMNFSRVFDGKLEIGCNFASTGSIAETS